MPAFSPDLAALRQQIKFVLKEGNSVYAAVQYATRFRTAVNESSTLPCARCFLEVFNATGFLGLRDPSSLRNRCERCSDGIEL
jgi:hypothetical protein